MRGAHEDTNRGMYTGMGLYSEAPLGEGGRGVGALIVLTKGLGNMPLPATWVTMNTLRFKVWVSLSSQGA
jgi:hypothetical protein